VYSAGSSAVWRNGPFCTPPTKKKNNVSVNKCIGLIELRQSFLFTPLESVGCGQVLENKWVNCKTVGAFGCNLKKTKEQPAATNMQRQGMDQSFHRRESAKPLYRPAAAPSLLPTIRMQFQNNRPVCSHAIGSADKTGKRGPSPSG